MPKKRILSGMRPTGKLHLGNYAGALENWIELQDEYDNFFFVADWHSLTTNPMAAFEVKEKTQDMVIDWLSAGIKPENPIFIQSQIKEHAELHLVFSMLITTARLERNPTLKEQVRDLSSEVLLYGHLEDQAPHVEITREIARKFNSTYDVVFPEPETKLTSFSRLPGLDGRKMGKSNNNFILMSDSEEDIFKSVRTAVTDPEKIRRNDPGHPDICNVFAYHQKFNSDEVPQIKEDCMSGVLGCVDCKKNCATRIAKFFERHREKREYYLNHINEVKDIIETGNKKARMVAQATMADVHAAMNMG
jgi:tryptophanyl-tRNA synthetase